MDVILVVASALAVAAILSTRVAQRFGVPTLVVFVGIGMLAGSSGPGGLAFDDYGLALNVGLLALAVILLSGGLDTKASAFREALLPASLLATLGVLVKMLLIAVLARVVTPFSWLEAMLLGAVLAPTDAAAVFSVLKGRGLPRRLRSVLEVESGTNDPVSVYLTVTIAAALAGAGVSVGDAVVGVVAQLALGAAIGWAGGRALATVLNAVEIPAFGLYPILVLAGGLLVYSTTNLLGGSGFLAIYVTGLILGNRPLTQGRAIRMFMDGIAWGAQITMFLLLGLLSFPDRLLASIPVALMVTATVTLVARPASLAVVLIPLGRWAPRFRFDARELTVLSWAGLKGAVPIILAIIPLLQRVPNGELLFDIVVVVVIAGTAVQGLTVVPLARLLGLLEPATPEPPLRLELGGAAPPGSGVFDMLLDTSAPAVGRTIGELELPDEIVIAAIARGNRMISPRGEVRFESGDHVYLITTEAGEDPIPAAFHARPAATAEAPVRASPSVD
ncbi:MAG: potassium/proton antiporter [Trueperaceae bacterium]|nr:potassium/proton antiporter [Trueperaceae bacterium]